MGGPSADGATETIEVRVGNKQPTSFEETKHRAVQDATDRTAHRQWDLIHLLPTVDGVTLLYDRSLRAAQALRMTAYCKVEKSDLSNEMILRLINTMM